MTRILSIDGGGTRGILPASILSALENLLEPNNVRDTFDIIIGTSTGGIIALSLAAGLKAREIEELFLTKSKKIFQDNLWDNVGDLFGNNTGAQYDIKNLEDTVKQALGDRTLGNLPATDTGNEHTPIVLIPTFNLYPEKPVDSSVNFRPHLFNSWYRRDQEEKLYKLACRTAAAPTYFQIYEQQYADGGIALNNPGMAAVAFAINSNKAKTPEYGGPEGFDKGLGESLDNIQVLSLGTGTSNDYRISKETIREKRNGDWGKLQWVSYLGDLLTESNQQVSHYYLSQVLKTGHYKRITFNLRDYISQEVPLDTTDKGILKKMQQIGHQYTEEHHHELLQFLNQNGQLT